ncbi:hypothetical protein RPALISO_97 [Ruegeria phage RpAliso]|nr:hypothetical protein RPALISO_97 [Ruegeria phage RpAliso]
MFRKKNTQPETVAEAIAPFSSVKANLVKVIGKSLERRQLADKRIADAKAYAAQVEVDEAAAAFAADAEIEQARRIADALSSLLGEPPVSKEDNPTQEQLRAEQASAHT